MNKTTVITPETRRVLVAMGRRIKMVRKIRGHTSFSLAAALGVSQAHVSRMETGLQGLRCVTLLRLAKVLNVSPMIFFMDHLQARVMLKSLPDGFLRGVDLACNEERPKNRGQKRR